MVNWLKQKKGLGLVVTVLAMTLLLVLNSCAPTGVAPGEKTVKTGVSLILTGIIASSGAPVSNGILDYVKYLNEELGGIEYTDPKTGKTERVRLNVAWEDNAYSAAKGLTIYKRQKAAGVQAMVIFSHPPAEAVSPMASRDRMPIYAPYANPNAALFANKPLYTLPTLLNYHQQPVVVAQWVKEVWEEARTPRLGCICIETVSVRGAIETPEVKEYVEELGVEWLGVEWVPPAVTDTTIELTRMMAKKPDFIFLIHVVAGGKVFAEDAVRMGLKDKAEFIYNSSAFCEDTIKVAGEAVEGIYGFTYTALPDEDLPGVNMARRLCMEYRGQDLNSLYLIGCLFSMQFVEGLRLALEEVGYEDLTGPVINDCFHTMTNFDTGGITPSITIDPEFPVATPYIKMCKIEKGKMRAISDFIEASPLPKGLRVER